MSEGRYQPVITLGNILSILTTAVMFASTLIYIGIAWGRIESAIKAEEQHRTALERRIDRETIAQDRRIETGIARVEGTLNSISARLDRVLEQQRRSDAAP